MMIGIKKAHYVTVYANDAKAEDLLKNKKNFDAGDIKRTYVLSCDTNHELKNKSVAVTTNHTFKKFSPLYLCVTAEQLKNYDGKYEAIYSYCTTWYAVMHDSKESRENWWTAVEKLNNTMKTVEGSVAKAKWVEEVKNSLIEPFGAERVPIEIRGKFDKFEYDLDVPEIMRMESVWPRPQDDYAVISDTNFPIIGHYEYNKLLKSEKRSCVQETMEFWSYTDDDISSTDSDNAVEVESAHKRLKKDTPHETADN